MIFRKRLPHPCRRSLWIATSSYRRYWYRSLEAIHGDLFAAVERWITPGAVVWDIGGNVGVFAFSAALRAGVAGKVFVFEADVDCAALMTRSLELRCGPEAQVVVCPFAVADLSGTVTFEISAYRTAASSIQGFGRFAGGGIVREIPAFSVDDLARSLVAPTVMKVDVEGAENLVLRGARRTIERCKPLLLVECSGGEAGQQSGAFLREVGYEWRPWTAELPFSQERAPQGDIVARPR